MTKSLLPWATTLMMLSGTAVADESQDLASYIYNGTTATTGSSGEFPSFASIYYDALEYTGYYGLYCGATILDAQHVLTAAHCLHDGSGSLNEAYLIATSIVPQMENESQFAAGTVEVIRAAEFYVHSDYVDSSSSTDASWPNDIAIIKLESEMNISTSDYVVTAASTEVSSYRVSGETFVAVGHGYTETGDGQELLQTDLSYQSADECSFSNLNDSQLCMAGEYDSSTRVRNSTCSGDSGGPLYWHNGTEYVQAGITSYGWSSCYSVTTDDTSVFTEVIDYQEWIDSVLSGELTPDYSVTEEERDSYFGVESSASEEDSSEDESDGDTTSDADTSVATTSSSASGGSVGILIVGLLFLLLSSRHTFGRDGEE